MVIASLGGSRCEVSKEVVEEEACDITPLFKKSMLDRVYNSPMPISESLLCLHRPPLCTLFDAIPNAGGPSFALVPCSSSNFSSLGHGDG
jgi:hypothetical protein